MTSIGEMLRHERLKRNLDLDRISSDLKISRRLLEAIEEERFEKLPGGVFTKSFVRQYGRYLGFDDDEISGQLQQVLDPQPVNLAPMAASRPAAEIDLPRMKTWESVSDHSSRWPSFLPSLALVVVMMLACSAVYSWWQRSRNTAKETAHAPAVRTKSHPVPAPPQQAETKPPSSDGAARDVQPSPAAPAAPTNGTNPIPAAQTNQIGPANPQAPVHVQMTAQEPVWVSIRSDGKSLFSGTLQANETRLVDASDTVVVRLGNAGGINISVNGKAIGPVGPKGQIRTVQLTSGGFQIGLPEPKPAEPAPGVIDPL